ncbi:hypothetical protein CYMTET_43487 [Cymbomonas tetramitiformis]|uniref:Uncharacterized protein n=1 Tax=Cymbomonas tetramitiformis TaxID=36881 RepID=A0AAE0C3Z9_9CHLO|nr:hypothetical protein CYMTET_43487 [Cymbomonas tetramitiformis]
MFDNATRARHAVTPQTHVASAPPVNSAGDIFLAAGVRTLQREHFDVKDSAFAPLFTLDDAALAVRVEANALLYSTLELLVHPTSPAADWMDGSSSAFPSDGTRVLLEFARRLMHSDAPFQGTSDMLGVRVIANVDTHDAISDFNAALKAARTRSTLDEEDVKSLFIQARWTWWRRA